MKRTLLALTLVTAFFGSHTAFADTNSTRYPHIAEADVSAVHGVNWDNYVQAETDWNFRQVTNKVGVNQWIHDAPVSKDNQTVIRSNRDVVYSIAVVDVSKGATFSVTDKNNDEFQIIHIIDENHLTHKVVRRGESVTITPDDLSGGNYVYLLARTKDNGNLADTQRRQKLLSFTANSAKPYTAKGFTEQDVVDYRLKLINNVMTGKATVEGVKGFGRTLNDVSDKDYRYAAAFGWGGLMPTTAQYLEAVPGQGATECQEWRIPQPKLNRELGGYWSLTTYGPDGWIAEENFYMSGDKMKDNGDGTSSVYFNCGGELAEYSLDVVDNWAAIARFYEPTDVQETLNYLQTLRGISVKPVQ
ncbi:TPA: DUF1254 domain-containing protein [Vibrio vulnificus]|nr:DUF1254 domain-containing protein [Vibrio vulnificus]